MQEEIEEQHGLVVGRLPAVQMTAERRSALHLKVQDITALVGKHIVVDEGGEHIKATFSNGGVINMTWAAQQRCAQLTLMGPLITQESFNEETQELVRELISHYIGTREFKKSKLLQVWSTCLTRGARELSSYRSQKMEDRLAQLTTQTEQTLEMMRGLIRREQESLTLTNGSGQDTAQAGRVTHTPEQLSPDRQENNTEVITGEVDTGHWPPATERTTVPDTQEGTWGDEDRGTPDAETQEDRTIVDYSNVFPRTGPPVQKIRMQQAQKISVVSELNSITIGKLESELKLAKAMDNDYSVQAVLTEAVRDLVQVHVDQHSTWHEKDLVMQWHEWEPEEVIDLLRSMFVPAGTVEDGGTRSAFELISQIANFKDGFVATDQQRNVKLLQDIHACVKKTVYQDWRMNPGKEKMREFREKLFGKIKRASDCGTGIIEIVTDKLKVTSYSWHDTFGALYGALGSLAKSERESAFFGRNKKSTEKPESFSSKRKSNSYDGRDKERSGKVSTSGHEYATKRAKTSTNAKDACRHCGRTSHKDSECLFTGAHGHAPHPDVNMTDKPWHASEKGKAWAKHNPSRDVLPTTWTLDGKGYTPPSKLTTPPKQKKGGCELNTINQSACHIVVDIEHPNMSLDAHRVVTLVDTGATGFPGNFISVELAEICKEMGYKEDSSDVTVCGCFNNCETMNRSIHINISLSEHQKIEVNCLVINTKHSLILGWETIKNNQNLQVALMALFTNNDDDASRRESPWSQGTVDNEGTGVSLGHFKNWTSASQGVKGELTGEGSDNLMPRNEIEVNSMDNIEEDFQLVTIEGPDHLQTRIRAVCERYKNVFSTKLNKEAARVTPMEVKLNNAEQWASKENTRPPRTQAPSRVLEIQKQVNNMLEAGVIRPSKAQSYSQVMLTPKSDGTMRFCIDYRRLNNVTANDRYPLPNIRVLLQRLGEKRAKYFAVLDLTKGYYQAAINEASRALTAFITPTGLYEWNRVPMGLSGSPGYFQRIMVTEVLYNIIMIICENYLDDIIVHGTTDDEFIANLSTVLQRLQDKGLTVNPKKCRLGLSTIEYVGHTINQEGMSFTREKLQKAISFAKPIRAKQLKSFLGMVNYFRDHIKNHSTIVAPLTKLLEKYNAKHVLDWNAEADTAFIDIKQAVNDCPTLFFLDMDADIHLYTDASDKGIGGYLCQIIDGKERPVAFYSKKLTPTEQRWGTPCLECYAIYQAFRHFDYLLRDAFTTVHTDHANLVYIRDAVENKIIRWKLELQEYNFTLQHIAGVDNIAADVLSRNPAAEEDEFEIDTPIKAVNMLNYLHTYEQHAEACCEKCQPQKPKSTLFCMDCQEQQLNASDSWKTFTIPEGAYQDIRAVHNAIAGHHGVEATLKKLFKQKKKWQYMREHIRKFIYDCDVCQKNSYSNHEIRIERFTTGRYQPMERWSVDTVHIPRDANGNKYIVGIIDCFSRFLGLYPIPEATRYCIAGALMRHAGFFGIPFEIISDKGGEFINDVIEEFLEF